MRKNVITLLALAMVLLSCGKEAAVHADSCSISFTAGGVLLDVTTKAAAVTSLQSFNVNCVTGTPGTSESPVFNSSFSGPTTYTGGKYWPSSDRGYKFYASNATIVPSSSGPSVTVTNTVDVVCAACLSPSYRQSNQLSFSHIFARIGKCSVSAPSGYEVSGLTVKITPKTGGTYNLFKGNGKTDGTGWSEVSSGSALVIADAVGSTSDNGLYLVPGNYAVTVDYTLSTGAYSEKFTRSGTVTVSAGKINDISCTLPSGNAVPISFTVTIAPWTTDNVSLVIS